MLVHIALLIAGAAILSLVQSQQLPAVLPLAVKSPYLNYWTQDPVVSSHWTMFWTNRTVGWSGMVRIDGRAYQWFGIWVPDEANVISRRVTPTQTILTYSAGPAHLTATFLSPIERSDPVKQSMPFAYVTVDISFPDNSQHDVEVYMDMTGEFVSIQDDDLITWGSQESNQSVFFTLRPDSIQLLAEDEETAQDIVAILGTVPGPQVSISPGTEQIARTQFGQSGVVVTDPSIQPPMTMGNPRLTFSIYKSLGKISATSEPVVFAIGMYRDPSASLKKSTGETQQLSPLFATKYATVSDTVDAFISDYTNAKARADDLDQMIVKAVEKRSITYQNFVSLAARQTMATTEILVSQGSDGQWNLSNVKMFMKDIGDSHRVNPVEKLYLSFPFFLFINTTYAGQLLLPLFEAQSASPAQPYAQKDIGQKYPQADERFVEHQQQVEHTSSMLIMSLSHARYSGDGTLISNYYSLLQKWADYLVKSTMNPPDMTTIDGAPQANSTNLVIKGIIAIKAMSVISNVTGRRDDSNRYSDVASEYLDDWISRLSFQASEPYLPAMLDKNTTWAKIYNLYADALLGTNLIPDNIYELHTRFYGTQSALASGETENGTTNVINTASTFFAAAAISDASIQDDIISPLWNYVLNASQPLRMTYPNGSTSQGAASPALGAVFAPLVFDLEKPSIRMPSPTPLPQETGGHSIIGPLVGGVMGGLTLILLIALALRVRQKRVQQKGTDESLGISQPFTSSASMRPYRQKPRVEIVRNTISSFAAISQTQSLQTVPGPSNSDNLSTDNARLLAELSAEVQALRREIWDDQRLDPSPPPSYVTRPTG